MVAYERDLDTFLLKSIQLIEVFPSARSTTKYRRISEAQAYLTVKTYDAESGAIVKFRTDKTVDLGRLLVANTKLGLSFLGRSKQGEEEGDAEMVDVEPREVNVQATEKNEAVNETAGDKKKKNKKKKGKK